MVENNAVYLLGKYTAMVYLFIAVIALIVWLVEVMFSIDDSTSSMALIIIAVFTGAGLALLMLLENAKRLEAIERKLDGIETPEDSDEQQGDVD